MNRRLLVAVWIAWMLPGAWPHTGRCAEGGGSAAEAEPAGVVRFRRVYAPADQLQDWPLGNVQYMPVEPADFERLVQTSQTTAARTSVAARAVTAQYRGRMDGAELITGQATVDVELSDGAATLLPLGPCGLAISNARWSGGESTPGGPDEGRQSPASLGAGYDGELAVLVEKSGRLEFDWSLAGRRDAAGAVTFRFEAPSCPASRLILDLPEEMTLSADNGVVAEAGSAGEGFRRWQVELGGRPCCRLRTSPAEAKVPGPRAATVWESAAYRFSLRGLDVSTDLNFVAHDQPLHQVTLALDPGLRLVGAEYGDTPVRWTATPADGDPQARVTIALPDAIEGTGRVLRLRALAPLVLDRLAKLPRIHPQGLFWQEGRATLLVPAPLLIRQLVPVGCRQRGIPLLAGESAEFQYFRQDASIEILISRHRASVQLASGTSIDMRAGQITAEVQAVYTVQDGDEFVLEAEVGRRWLIDSVETLPPPSLIDQWTLEKTQGGKQKLVVRLAKALSPTQSVRLVIAARRLQSSLDGDIVPLRFLAPADCEDMEVKHLVAVRAMGSYRLKLVGDEHLRRINPRSLDAAEMKLFTEPPRDLLFEGNDEPTALQIELERQEPLYSGELRVEATVGDQRLAERYVVDCRPQSARVDRVVVRFSHSRDTELRWALGAEDDRQLDARRLSLDELTDAALDPDRETWELTLRRPRSEPFKIIATREVGLGEDEPISLASLPDAVAQRGKLVILSRGSQSVRIANRGLTSIPAETVVPGRYRTVCATYRYDPEARATTEGEPAVSVSVSGKTATPPAWIWDARLDSRYEADGTGRHLATYRLECCRPGALQLSLPPPTRPEDVRGVWVDGDRAAWRKTGGDGLPALAVDLPDEERFPTVSIDFTTPAVGLGVVGSLQPPLPETNLPILRQWWTVWLPAGYEACYPDAQWQICPAPPSSWRQRLFGPLGRTSETAFDPLAPDDWTHMLPEGVFRNDVRQDPARADAEQFLQALGREATDKAATQSGGLNWGDLLAAESLNSPPSTLLIDRHATSRAALTPQTPVRPGDDENPAALGARLLQGAGLSLLIHTNAVLLTSHTDAALLHACLEPLGHRVLWRVLPGPLADRLTQAAAGSADDDPTSVLVPVGVWKSLPAEPNTFWIRGNPAGRQPSDAHGWKAYRLAIADVDAAPPLRIVHRPTVRLLGSVTFLLVVGLGWWKARNRPVLLTSLAGGFGLAALLLPEACVPIVGGAVLGCVFCLAYRLVRLRNRPRTPATAKNRRRNPATTVSAARPLSMIVAVLASMGALSAVARGQPTEAKSPQTVPPVYRVFIPVDEQEQPSGGKYQVPLEFYNLLRRRAAAAAEQPQAWLIVAATYRGVLSKPTASEPLTVDELKAIFDLQVFGPAARVRLPMQTNLLPDGALLDGQVIRPEFEADGKTLVFDVPQGGQYRLELSLQPTMRAADAPTGFDLDIPRAATSRLELTLPSAAPSIEVPTAVGAIRHQDDPRRLVAELGPTDRLSVNWSRGTGAAGSGPAVDVEELLWLKVQPASVVVEARLKLKIIEGPIRQLRLATDSRLRLLPIGGDAPPTVETRTVPGQPQTITLKWPEPVSDQAVVDATFLLRQTSGVGNLQLPRLEVLDARSTRRWLAVSVGPELQYREPPAGRFEAVAVPDFQSAWGAAESEPRFALRLDSNDTDWSISTYPCETVTTADQELTLSFDRDGADVYFDAELETTGGYNFRYRLSWQGPIPLQVKQASLTADNVQHVARWTQDDQGVTLFLAGPVDGRQKLSLRGRLPIRGKRKTTLPVMRIEGSQLQSSAVRLFRRPSVLVAVDGVNGSFETEDAATGGNDPQWGRPVAQFSDTEKQPAKATLTLEPNRPVVEAVEVLRLHHDGRSWVAELQGRIVVAEPGGLVDQIRVDVDNPSFRPTVDPPATLNVVDPPGEPAYLVVEPSEAIDGEYEFTVSGPLEMAYGEGVPTIGMRQSGPVTRLLCLPQRAQDEAIAWDISGFEQAELPEPFDPPPPGEPFETYKVVDESYGAILRSVEKTDEARVRLADVYVAWDAEGSCRGVTTFDLEPGTSAEVPLWLPSPCRLVQVTVAGVPVSPLAEGAGVWRVPLGPERLPQRIEVVFTGRLPEADGDGRRFEAPTLGELPVDQTLWTVVGPPELDPVESAELEASAAESHQLVRLRSLAAMVEKAAAATAADEPDEMLNCCRTWARRLAAARTEFMRHSSQGIPDDLLLKLSNRTRAILQNPVENGAPTDDPLELWRRSLDPRQTAFRCTFWERSPSITLVYRRAEAGRWHPDLLPAGGLLLLTGLMVVGLRRGTLAEWFKRWPAAFGVAVGLAWWLWLQPGVLGWVIVAASLAASAFSGWKHVRPPAGSSVISKRSLNR